MKKHKQLDNIDNYGDTNQFRLYLKVGDQFYNQFENELWGWLTNRLFSSCFNNKNFIQFKDILEDQMKSDLVYEKT